MAVLNGCDNYYLNELYDTCNYSTARIRIPVIFHVVYRNDQQNIPTKLILQELNDLNRDFQMQNSDIQKVLPLYRNLIANPNIEFYLAPLIDKKFSDTGIIRVKRGLFDTPIGASPVIDPAHYLNVYIYKRWGNEGAHTLPRPWSNPLTDAIYINWNEVGLNSRILTHETGHWLGLMHIFECGECTDAGDGIADTLSQSSSSDGGFKITNDDSKLFPTNCNQQPGMYHNFMDYSYFRRMFTADQVKRMRIIITAKRPQLLR